VYYAESIHENRVRIISLNNSNIQLEDKRFCPKQPVLPLRTMNLIFVGELLQHKIHYIVVPIKCKHVQRQGQQKRDNV